MNACRLIEGQPAAFAALTRQLLDRAASRQSARYLIGIAGIPGAGKSTLASMVVEQACGGEPHRAALVPMDGFHFGNAELGRRGLRDRKGSPETFDAASYLRLLTLSRQRGTSMYFPVYDRALHEPALHEVPRQRIFPQTQIILTEGNYLLLDADPWRHLADVLDECWWVDTPVDQARQWIVDRHIRGGKSPEQAAQHYAKVDWPNTQLILNHRRAADLTISMKSH